MDDPVSEKHSIPIEETPIIDEKSGEVIETPRSGVSYESRDVIPEAAQMFGQTPEVSDMPAQQPAPESAKEPVSSPLKTGNPGTKQRKFHAGSVIFIVMLFGLGIWLSLQLRSFFTPDSSSRVVVPTTTPEVLPPEPQSLTPVSATPSANTQWTVYSVISGVTKTAVPGVSYKLPAQVAAPVCDSSSCPSQGTNLPGGTRFTVAPRGKGQQLPDFRGAILTDASGHEFTMQQTTIGGVYAYEYVGDFTGRTGGGYTFAKMRGVLVPVNDSLAVEFNHFAPQGTTADFAADDALFNSIVATFTFTAPVPTQATAPSATSSAN